MKTTILTRGRLVLPAERRQRDEVAPGQEFAVEWLGARIYRLERIGGRTNQGLVDWLLACREKDWFVPVASASRHRT